MTFMSLAFEPEAEADKGPLPSPRGHVCKPTPTSYPEVLLTRILAQTGVLLFPPGLSIEM